MFNSISSIGSLLISMLVDIYIFVLLLRVILDWVNADYYNPIAKLVLNLTKPLVDPLMRIIPRIGKLNLAAVILMLIFEIIKFYLVGFIALGLAHIGGVLILSCVDLIKITLNTFFYAIIIQVIVGWINPGYSPLGHFLKQITAPILNPIRRVTPPVGGIDFTPLIALIILFLLIFLVINPLAAYSVGIAFG